MYFILLSPSTRKYEALTIIWCWVMKQWYFLHVLLCSYYIAINKTSITTSDHYVYSLYSFWVFKLLVLRAKTCSLVVFIHQLQNESHNGKYEMQGHVQIRDIHRNASQTQILRSLVCPIVSTEHGGDTTALCVKFQSDWTTETNVMDERDYA